MSSLTTRAVMTALALVGFAGTAHASIQYESVFLGDCDAMGCEGSTLFLSVEQTEPDTWVVTYTINTENYYGDQIGINQVGFKALKGVDWSTATVETYFPPPPERAQEGYDFVVESPISSNSLCEHTSGDTDKACSAGFVSIEEYVGQTSFDYTWVFTIEGAEGATLMDVSEWHLGAQYANGYWRSRGHIISAAIPEPTAALLFGLGATLVVRRVRRH